MSEKKGMDALEIGMVESFSKTVAEADVYAFAGITGDFYGVHVDEEFAKKTRYGTRIAHGLAGGVYLHGDGQDVQQDPSPRRRLLSLRCKIHSAGKIRGHRNHFIEGHRKEHGKKGDHLPGFIYQSAWRKGFGGPNGSQGDLSGALSSPFDLLAISSICICTVLLMCKISPPTLPLEWGGQGGGGFDWGHAALCPLWLAFNNNS